MEINFSINTTISNYSNNYWRWVLVLGTPSLLLLNYNIIETINLLLPISILTSF